MISVTPRTKLALAPHVVPTDVEGTTILPFSTALVHIVVPAHLRKGNALAHVWRDEQSTELGEGQPLQKVPLQQPLVVRAPQIMAKQAVLAIAAVPGQQEEQAEMEV